MTEIELGSNLTAIITSIITVIIGYLTAKGLIKLCPIDKLKKSKTPGN